MPDDSTAQAFAAAPAATSPRALAPHITAACRRMAPLWPLQQFVAVNPFQGLSDWKFHDAADLLARVAGARLYMPRSYYRTRVEDGRIAERDIELALARCGSRLDVASIRQAVTEPAPEPDPGMPLVTAVLDAVEDHVWTDFVTESISRFCAAYADQGQANFTLPWRDQPLYTAWCQFAARDLTPAAAGLADFHHHVAALPSDPREAITRAVRALGIPESQLERYLHAALLSIGGWSAWMRYRGWQAELAGERDDSVMELLAIRVAWEALIYRARLSETTERAWQAAVGAALREPTPEWRRAVEIDRVLLAAAEFAYQRRVITSLRRPPRAKTGLSERPAVQAAFCIDVRSEVLRRALETVAPHTQTLGFAGFFGAPIEYVPLGATEGRPHVPVLLTPGYRVYECCGHDRQETARLGARRRERIGLGKVWKQFKFSAASCFSFVESSGMLYAHKLLSDSLGWSRPVPDPRRHGLDADHHARLMPSLEAMDAGGGIPEIERADLAERILRGMSLTDHLARLVLLIGHGATTVNNPHAAGLDCGACAGQSGEASARVVVALLNDPGVRRRLGERGIVIPEDTHFLAGLHDTTTDRVTLFDTKALPETHAADLASLREGLEQASELTRIQRAARLGLDGADPAALAAALERRSRDWSQVRPEWALANNAAFIAAPRERTAGVDLDGRAFLHDYRWQDDTDFQVLELIMTAPMIVAHWINMQYYGSTVDNRRFGSGNKVLHNVVGGAVGVLEGNGGDLRTGLPLQSLHDGEQWMHEPLRLSVFIEAPRAAIDDVVSRHETVRELVENGWLHLFRIGESGNVYRRRSTREWVRADTMLHRTV
ncbi:MAG: DUF2309 domain-containing protein [Chromatiales bacterium]|nr:DUF2309 domain-containing protein [Chromatiales bacterium]